jgi:ketosteroid isomerase-like protein
MNEADIRHRIESGVSAIRARDIEGMMSLYALDVVSFDVNPPLRYEGIDAKRRVRQEVFAAYSGPIGYEIAELDITAHRDLAFVRGTNHVSGTLVNGRRCDFWVRWTACFRQIDGLWLVVHDHVSVPADLLHGQAVLDLQP